VKHRSAVSPDLQTKLDAFGGLLARWNRRVNLVADAAPEHIWRRHILDSLQIAQYLPPTTSLIADVGSGGGFPGLVLAIAEPARKIQLVEADKRKSAFLCHAVQTLALANASVIARRIEDTDLQADVITARAVAPVARLLDWIAPKLASGGIALLPKGKTAEDELTLALTQWRLRIERFPSCTDEQGVILRLSEIARLDRTT